MHPTSADLENIGFAGICQWIFQACFMRSRVRGFWLWLCRWVRACTAVFALVRLCASFLKELLALLLGAAALGALLFLSATLCAPLVAGSWSAWSIDCKHCSDDKRCGCVDKDTARKYRPTTSSRDKRSPLQLSYSYSLPLKRHTTSCGISVFSCPPLDSTEIVSEHLL